MKDLMPVLDFGVTAFLAAGMLLMLHRYMAEVSEKLGEIIGMLEALAGKLDNLESHIQGHADGN